VLIAQLLSMVAWVLLSGLSSPVQSGNASGLVMRAVLGAVVLGLIAWRLTRAGTEVRRSLAVLGALIVGAAIAPLWRTVGVDYFDNVKAWLQEGSTLTLMGGLRGVATRLTLWLALLGASLATGAGRHINIDVIFRFVPARGRKPIALVNYCAAALMCLGAVWGFFDHIAIESYGAKADDAAGTKISVSMARMGDHFFLMRKQIGLDFKSLPHIIKGDRYDRWMSPGEWNAWVKDAGFDGKYEKELVETILVPEDAPPHTPLVLAPDGESTRGILVHDLSLVFPFGMLVIALRFLLRVILALSGHVELDPDAAHKEEIGGHHEVAQNPEPEKEAA
jgi:TRAP-type C4-dicarboxylate transport system permease small subunit